MSQTSRLPAGVERDAVRLPELRRAIAGPPSPPNPAIPVPATVETMPVFASMRRTTWASRSTMKRLPARSKRIS